LHAVVKCHRALGWNCVWRDLQQPFCRMILSKKSATFWNYALGPKDSDSGWEHTTAATA
jgi:hypothetical protein